VVGHTDALKSATLKRLKKCPGTIGRGIYSCTNVIWIVQRRAGKDPQITKRP
jgi:hypothetical protein